MDVRQAKQELKQCSYLMLEVENLEELIKRKMQKLDIQPAQYTDIPKSISNTKDKIASTISQVEELEELKDVIEHQDYIYNVQQKISIMELSQERTLLRMRYIQNMQFKQIAYKFNCTERSIHTLHSSALINYSRIA